MKSKSPSVWTMTATETRRDNSTWRGAHNLVTKCAIFVSV